MLRLSIRAPFDQQHSLFLQAESVRTEPASSPHGPVLRRLEWAATILLLCLLASSISAAPRDADAWLLGAAVEFGGVGHTGKGNSDGGLITGFRAPPVLGSGLTDLGDKIIEEDSSREEIASILMGADVELMAPALFESAGAPRFFLNVGVFDPLTREVGLAREADPGIMGPPPGTGEVGESAVAGRGSKMTVQHQGPQVHAGIGIAFEIALWDTEYIRIKPSVVYSRVPADVYVVAHRPIRIAPTSAPFDSRFRFFQESDKFREVYHGVGPAVEIEYDMQNRLGPFGTSIYAKVHASHLLGDLKTRFRLTNSDPAGSGEFVTFKYSQDRWMTRVMLGFRVRWLPERLR